MKELTFHNLMSLSTILHPFIFLFVYLYTKNKIYLYGLFGLGVVYLITDLLKKNVFMNNVRPEGAKDCDIFNSDGDVSGNPGFPSGHSSTATFTVLFFLYNLNKDKINYSSVVLLIYLFLVLYSRLYKKCHTQEQILAGVLVGSLGFFVMYKLDKV